MKEIIAASLVSPVEPEYGIAGMNCVSIKHFELNGSVIKCMGTALHMVLRRQAGLKRSQCFPRQAEPVALHG